MTTDPLQGTAARLRHELTGRVPERPSVAVLRRRHAGRRVARATAAASVVVVAVVAVSWPISGPDGPTIDPVTPPDVEAPDGPDEPDRPALDDPEVVPLDIDEPVPLEVLAVRFNRPSFAAVDLPQGETVVYPPGAHGLPGDAIGGATILRDGTVVVWQDGTVRAMADGLAEPTLVHTPDPLLRPPDMAPSVFVVPDADERGLWVVQPGTRDGGLAELVDLATGRVEVAAELPPSSFPAGATSAGVVVTAWPDGNGSAGRHEDAEVVVVGRDRTVTHLADGEALAAGDDHVLVRTCVEPGTGDRCHVDVLDVVDVTTGDRQVVERPATGSWGRATRPIPPGYLSPWIAAAPDGRFLVAVVEPREGYSARTVLVTVDPADAGTEILHELVGDPVAAAWDREGEHVVITQGFDRDLVVLDPATGETMRVEDVVPEDHLVVGMG